MKKNLIIVLGFLFLAWCSALSQDRKHLWKEVFKFETTSTIYEMSSLDSNLALFYYVGDDPKSGKVNALVQQTTNGGITWEFMNLPTADTRYNEIVSSLDLVNKNCLWYSNAWGKIFQSSDFGLTWNKKLIYNGKELLAGTFHNLSMYDCNNGIMLTATDDTTYSFTDSCKGNILVATNDGWQTSRVLKVPEYIINFGDVLYLLKAQIVCVSPSVYIVKCFNLKEWKEVSYRTEDGGKTWKNIEDLFPGFEKKHSPVFKFIDDKQGYAMTFYWDSLNITHLVISETKDGGKTWEKYIYKKFTSEYLNIAKWFNIVGDELLIGPDLIRSYNKGQTWIKDTIDAEYSPNASRTAFKTRGATRVNLINFKNKGVIKDMGAIGISEVENSVDQKEIKVYPNPTSGQIAIKLGKEKMRSEIKIVNMLGEKVKDISIEGIINADISDLPAGNYILMIKQGGQIYSENIVKE